MCPPDVNLVRLDRSPLSPPPTPHWSSVLQGYQAEIPAKKLKRGHRKKNFWPNFGWFYQKQAEKGPQKIFKRSSLFLAVITVINLIFNIQYTNFLRPLFCLFLVKSAKIRPEIFFLWPLLSFLAGISAWQPRNTELQWGVGGGEGRGDLSNLTKFPSGGHMAQNLYLEHTILRF